MLTADCRDGNEEGSGFAGFPGRFSQSKSEGVGNRGERVGLSQGTNLGVDWMRKKENPTLFVSQLLGGSSTTDRVRARGHGNRL